jgi:hypothetical protein
MVAHSDWAWRAFRKVGLTYSENCLLGVYHHAEALARRLRMVERALTLAYKPPALAGGT